MISTFSRGLFYVSSLRCIQEASTFFEYSTCTTLGRRLQTMYSS
jgi:hypothetical protein